MQWPTPMPKWLDHAFRHRGLREIPGPKHNPTIQKWLHRLGAWWTDDETPWCGAFVAHCLQVAGLPYPKHWYRAKAYGDYGQPCNKDSIPFGAICVKSRTGGGHVFFAVARSRDGNTIYGLGGNQRNMVNITSFSLGEIDSVRWPPSGATRLALPAAESASKLNAQAAGGTES